MSKSLRFSILLALVSTSVFSQNCVVNFSCQNCSERNELFTLLAYNNKGDLEMENILDFKMGEIQLSFLTEKVSIIKVTHQKNTYSPCYILPTSGDSVFVSFDSSIKEIKIRNSEVSRSFNSFDSLYSNFVHEIEKLTLTSSDYPQFVMEKFDFLKMKLLEMDNINFVNFAFPLLINIENGHQSIPLQEFQNLFETILVKYDNRYSELEVAKESLESLILRY